MAHVAHHFGSFVIKLPLYDLAFYSRKELASASLLPQSIVCEFMRWAKLFDEAGSKLK